MKSGTQWSRFGSGPTLAGLMMAAGVFLIAIFFPRTGHNQWVVSQNDPPRHPVTWPRLDVIEVSREGGLVLVGGYLWNGSAGKHRFEISSDGGVVIRFGESAASGESVAYKRLSKGRMLTESFEAELPAGATPITIEYQASSPSLARFEVSLREAGRLIAPWRLYPAPPRAEQVSQQWWAWHGVWAGVWLVAAGFILGLGLAARALTSARADWAAMGGVAALAIAVRVAAAYERYQSTPDFYAMESIWDNFVVLARSLLTGNYQLAGSYYQQGAIVYMALAQIAAGPDLWRLYLFNAVVSGLACALILLAGWALFGRSAGLVAGALMALYAPLIHYQTTLQIVVPATFAGSLIVACAAWLLRGPGWRAAAALGLAAAAGSLSRSTLMGAVVGGPLAAWLASGSLSVSRRLALGAAAAASFGLAVLPMVLANASVGVYSVSSSGFPIAFFRGNNRDTMGVNEYFTDRELLARSRSGDEDNFNPETLRDIRADPIHWIKFLIHKAGMFWSGHEYSDRMIDFYTTGLARSFVLRGLWLGGAYSLTALFALAVAGAVLSWREPAARAATLVFGGMILAFMGLTILFPVTGRVRAPIQPALFPLAAAGALAILDRLPGRPGWRASWPGLAIASAAAAAAVALASYCETRLPGPTTVAADQLPATLIRTDVDFESKIRLVGYDAFDSDFRPGGYLDLALYWQALQPPGQDYIVFIHLLEPGLTRVAGADRVLGTANFPGYPASQWKPGEIVRQSYFIPLPRLEGAVPLRIIVGLRQDDRRLPIAGGRVEALDGNAAFLTGLAILPEPAAQWPEPARRLDLALGPELAITGTNLEETSQQPGTASIAVDVDWQALAHPPYRYHLFLHVLDSRGALAAQFDGPPVPEFPTDTWPPGSRWRGHYSIALPQALAPGDYQLVAGLYRLGDLERLPITAPESLRLPDNRFLLSAIRVEP